MGAHQPIAHRVFSVLLVALLLTSVVAPVVASSPAAAATTSPSSSIASAPSAGSSASISSAMAAGDNCLYALIGGSNWCHATEEEILRADLEQSETAIQTDLHYAMVSEWESQQRYGQLQDNYLEDTDVIASLAAKHAVATAWENGNSSSEANQEARQAVREYYTDFQVQMLESYEKQAATIGYVKNVSDNSSKVPHGFVAFDTTVDGGANGDYDGQDVGYTPGNETVEIDLVNGSSHEITVPYITAHYHYSTSSYNPAAPMDPFKSLSYNGDRFRWDIQSDEPGDYFDTNGVGVVMNVGDASEGGLESQRVADLREWRDAWDEVESQSNTVANNYDNDFADALYQKLDSGEIEPSDVRTPEGQVKWMSGNDSVTGDRYRLATLSVLGMENPDLTNTSTMVIDYEGYTSQSFTDATGSDRSVVYEDHVNKTYQGLLFSAEVPESGFELNTTYNTSNLNGTQVMYDEQSGEEVTFAKGNFTVREMYDADGNAVNSTSWQEPNYDTYNADGYVQYVNETKVYRSSLTSDGDNGGETTISIPNPFEDIGTGGALLGLGVIVAVIVAIVAFIKPY